MDLLEEQKKVRKKYPILKKMLPLKIGIHKDLIADGYSVRSAKRILWGCIYCEDYQKVLVAGAKRYDLAGQECGIVTQEEEEYAKALLESKVPGVKLRIIRNKVFNIMLNAQRIKLRIDLSVAEVAQISEESLKNHSAVIVKVVSGKNIYKAKLKGKTVRRQFAKLADILTSGNKASVVIQGVLEGKQLVNAGLVVTEKKNDVLEDAAE